MDEVGAALIVAHHYPEGKEEPPDVRTEWRRESPSVTIDCVCFCIAGIEVPFWASEVVRVRMDKHFEVVVPSHPYTFGVILCLWRAYVV